MTDERKEEAAQCGAPAESGGDAPPAWLQWVHPLDVRLWRGLRRHAGHWPLWKTMAWAAKECNLRVEVRRGGAGEPGPQIVVTNDPSALLGFVVLSLVPRDDVFFIGAPGWMHVGGSVTARCLPVFNVGSLRGAPKEWLRAQLLFRFRDGVPPSAAAERNRRSLKRAAEAVSGGGTLFVSPTAGSIARSDRWKHGIGLIARLVARDAGARVILCRVGNTTPRDAVRMLNRHWFAAARKEKVIPVDFADPVPLSKYRAPGMSSEETSLRLKDAYLRTFGAL